MKKLAVLLFLLNFHNVYSQCYDDFYCLSFEDTICRYHVTIDTTHYLDNVWQIGKTHKSVLDSTVCPTNVIITDTANPYPVNNHSVFIITNRATTGDVFGFRMFSANYYVQTDSLKDYGTIELSLDKGITWIDLIKDTAYTNNFVWWTAKPVLTGHSISCNNFEVDLTNLTSIHNFQVGDTILFRFSFLSDSIYDNSGGLVFDNICFGNFVEGVSEIHFKSIKSVIYPNPSASVLTIEFDNPNAEAFELAMYDMHSKRVLTREGVTENKIVIDTRSFKSGMYVYKITNVEAKKRCWGRFNLTK